MTRKLMNTGTVFAAVALAACAANAANVTFSNVTGDGDLAAGENWGGTFPTSGMCVLVDKLMTYTASSDVTFPGALQFQGVNADYIFSMSGRTITVGGKLNSYYSATALFDSGVWNVTGDFNPVNNAAYPCTMILTNGVVFNVSGNCTFNGNTKNSLLRVHGASKIYFNRGEIMNSNNNNCCIEILDGGEMSWQDGYFSPSATASSNCTVLVSGSGSKLFNRRTASAATLRFGTAESCDNRLRVESGATIDTTKYGDSSFRGTGKIGEGANAVSNIIEVVGGTYEGGSLIVNENATSWGNGIRISGGGAMSLGGNDLTVGGLGRSEIVVEGEGSSLSCKSVCIGKLATSTGCRFRIGDLATFHQLSPLTNRAPLFGAGSGNEMIVEGGATFDAAESDVAFSWSDNEAGGNRVTVRGEGTTMDVGEFTIGLHAGVSDGNVLEVSDGAEFVVCEERNFQVCSADSLVALSNATIRLQGLNSNAQFGKPVDSAQASITTNNQLLLQGAAPRFEVEHGNLTFENASRLVFEIPAEGYADVPLTASTIRLADDTVIDIACEAFQKALRSRATVVLARATTSLNVSQTVLDAANEKLLPLKRELKIDGTDLVLKVRPTDVGLVIILR